MSETSLPPDQEPASPIQAALGGPIIIRSWPKIIMMWPVLLVSLVCGVLTTVYPAPNPEKFETLHLVTLIFLVILAVNLMLLLYDLDLWGFLVLVLIMAVLVLALFLIDYHRGDVWQKIGKALSLRVYANGAFYFVFSLILIINLLIAWVITRFNYWRIEHNEIIIHRGFMHEQERHPTTQARFTLVIDDIVEYAILGAGKLVFTFGDSNKQHELTTVPFAHRKAAQLDVLLGRMAVTSQ
jgi:hypothetical protein